MIRVLFTAAHGGFSRERAPLGGGAAVYEQLMLEWQRTQPFEVHGITPAILGREAPKGRDLTGYSESRYADFSRRFERLSTQEILRHDPATTVVLANDISEGPDFATLAQRGYRVFTIFHVDVVDYVTRLYFRGRLAPETTVRWYRRLRWLLPDMAGLVWAKQEAVARHCRGLIVPSPRMRDVLIRCYPECDPARIHVLPWGNWHSTEASDSDAVAALRTELQLSESAQVILTLSRISPEKGQDLLLESFLDWERQGGRLTQPLHLIICGEAAFMQGKRHLEKLQHLASQLRQIRVHFPGHVSGDRKRAFFGLANVYAFPSRHDSYGLTLIEAMAAGVPSVCLDTHGARSVLRPEFGIMAEPTNLAATLFALLNDHPKRASMSLAARAYAEAHPFSSQAAQLAELLVKRC